MVKSNIVEPIFFFNTPKAFSFIFSFIILWYDKNIHDILFIVDLIRILSKMSTNVSPIISQYRTSILSIRKKNVCTFRTFSSLVQINHVVITLLNVCNRVLLYFDHIINWNYISLHRIITFFTKATHQNNILHSDSLQTKNLSPFSLSAYVLIFM